MSYPQFTKVYKDQSSVSSRCRLHAADPGPRGKGRRLERKKTKGDGGDGKKNEASPLGVGSRHCLCAWEPKILGLITREEGG